MLKDLQLQNRQLLAQNQQLLTQNQQLITQNKQILAEAAASDRQLDENKEGREAALLKVELAAAQSELAAKAEVAEVRMEAASTLLQLAVDRAEAAERKLEKTELKLEAVQEELSTMKDQVNKKPPPDMPKPDTAKDIPYDTDRQYKKDFQLAVIQYCTELELWLRLHGITDEDSRKLYLLQGLAEVTKVDRLYSCVTPIKSINTNYTEKPLQYYRSCFVNYY